MTTTTMNGIMPRITPRKIRKARTKIIEQLYDDLLSVMHDARDCGFILTCNHLHRLRDLLRSRCAILEFVFPLNERAELIAQFVRRACDILDAEKVDYDTKTVEKLAYLLYPDFRQTLIALESHSSTGILHEVEEAGLPRLLLAIKEKDFGAVRAWLQLNSHIDPHELMRTVYENCMPPL